jgi:hypothetical protein
VAATIVSIDWQLKDKNPIKVGDSFELEATLPVSATAGLSGPLALQTLDRQAFPLFEPGKDLFVVFESVLASQGLLVTAKFLAAEPGKWMMQSVLIVNKDLATILARTNPFTVEILTALPNEQSQAAGHLPPFELAAPDWVQRAWIVAWVLGFVSLIGLIVWAVSVLIGYWRRKKLTPRMRALTTLKDLLTGTPDDAILLRAAYFKTSATLKSYLGVRFGFNASESTTSELLDKLQPFLNPDEIDRIKPLWSQMDDIKFSGKKPSLNELKEVVLQAIKFLEVQKEPSNPKKITEKVKK